LGLAELQPLFVTIKKVNICCLLLSFSMAAGIAQSEKSAQTPQRVIDFMNPNHLQLADLPDPYSTMGLSRGWWSCWWS
jgi:hypothetical protein